MQPEEEEPDESVEGEEYNGEDSEKDQKEASAAAAGAVAEGVEKAVMREGDDTDVRVKGLIEAGECARSVI